MSYKAIIRRKGHKPITKTFGTKGEAKTWAAEQEALILQKRYNDPRLTEAVYLKAAANKKFYVFVLLLMHTGMRTGEAARLRKDDIDTKERKVTIWKTKTNKPRTIPLTHEAIEAIKQITTEENGYLFLKPHHFAAKNTMLRPGSIYRRS